MTTLFNHFESTNQRERAEIARNLQTLYNRWYQEENETFLAMRDAKGTAEFTNAQKNYIAAVSKLGAIQAVFNELGVEFEGLYQL